VTTSFPFLACQKMLGGAKKTFLKCQNKWLDDINGYMVRLARWQFKVPLFSLPVGQSSRFRTLCQKDVAHT